MQAKSSPSGCSCLLSRRSCRSSRSATWSGTFLATLLNCALWVFYGLPVVHPNSISLWSPSTAPASPSRSSTSPSSSIRLLPQAQARQDARRGARLRGRRRPRRPHPRGAVAHRGQSLHLLWAAPLTIIKQERGVHALYAVPGQLAQRHLLHDIRAHTIRHLHNGTYLVHASYLSTSS
jgi:hypothetical protein